MGSITLSNKFDSLELKLFSSSGIKLFADLKPKTHLTVNIVYLEFPFVFFLTGGNDNILGEDKRKADT